VKFGVGQAAVAKMEVGSTDVGIGTNKAAHSSSWYGNTVTMEAGLVALAVVEMSAAFEMEIAINDILNLKDISGRKKKKKKNICADIFFTRTIQVSTKNQ
jgi:hypothetical protein